MGEKQSTMAERKQQVFAILERDADMDGMTTTSLRDIGREIDLHHSYVSRIMDALAADKLIVFGNQLNYGIHEVHLQEF